MTYWRFVVVGNGHICMCCVLLVNKHDTCMVAAVRVIMEQLFKPPSPLSLEGNTSEKLEALEAAF